MNYKKIYNSIINNRRLKKYQGYTEKHHIIPRCLGGSNEKDNLVSVSAREHFILHLLLIKIYPEGTPEWIKMVKALNLMCASSENQKRIVPSKWYSSIREKISIAHSINQSGKNNSQYDTIWILNNDLKQSIKIPKKELDLFIAKGWIKGRRLNWNNNESKIKKNKNKNNQHKSLNQQKIDYYTRYYDIYNKYGWEEFIKRTGYDKSKPNLVQNFKKYVKNFIPQNGKKRGNSTFKIK